jgi:hypothetical protein
METCGAVYTGKSVLEYWKIPATSTIRDDASLRIFRNVDTLLHYVTSHPRRQLSSHNIFITKNQLINATMEMFAASSAKSYGRQTAWANNSVFIYKEPT